MSYTDILGTKKYSNTVHDELKQHGGNIYGEKKFVYKKLCESITNKNIVIFFIKLKGVIRIYG